MWLLFICFIYDAVLYQLHGEYNFEIDRDTEINFDLFLSKGNAFVFRVLLGMPVYTVNVILGYLQVFEWFTQLHTLHYLKKHEK